MEQYIAVFLGSIVFILLQLNKIFSSTKFKWSIFIKMNIIAFILNIVTGFCLVWLKEDLINIYPITTISAFFLGVSGQSIFNKITEMFDKKVSTTIGINE